MNPQPKQQRWQSQKYRKAAQGQPCTMRLNCCNGDTETTVLAHQNGAGIGTKHDDFNAADMCSDCHDIFDGRVKSSYSKEELSSEFERARYETMVNRIRRGILRV